MAEATWTLSPSGVYKNHAMSQQLREAAIADTVGLEFATAVDGYGKNRGESVTITRVAEVTEPTSGRLLETERIPEYQFALSTSAITVTELGGAIPFTSLFADFSEFDLLNAIQKRLKEQLSLVLDTLVFTAAKTALVKYAPTGVASSNLTTNGTFGAAATASLTAFHVNELVDTMYDSYRAPRFTGGDYVGIFRTRSIRSLMNDPDWEIWHQYLNPQARYNNEPGRYSTMRFVMTNHSNALGNVGTGSVLGEGIVLADDCLGLVEALAPELRAGVPQDGGRSQVMYWYALLECGLIYPTANAGEVRVIHVGSL